MRILTSLSVLFILLMACSDEDLSRVDKAISTACLKCDTSKKQMEWLRVLIEESKNSTQRGDFYIIETGQTSVIIHQPIIMSCMACIQYDCQGNQLSGDDLILLPWSAFNKATRIYHTPLE